MNPLSVRALTRKTTDGTPGPSDPCGILRRIGIWTILVGALVVTPTVWAVDDGFSQSSANLRDLQSDTWVATDAVGRRVATNDEVGPRRPDRWVGVFYFLWHGAHVSGGPWDNTRILNIDPEAIRKKDNPLWGPIGAPHHWGESIFGYYVGDDKWVLRKHAQMLADAGVDTLIFDTSNKHIYEKYYTALFDTLMELRAEGNATPGVAFLTPFFEPASTVEELYDKLYSKGLYKDLWFQWEGKPLILADPDQIIDAEGNTQQDVPTTLRSGHTLGQSFMMDRSFEAVSGCSPTWATRDSSIVVALYRDGPKGKRLAGRRFQNVADNAWLSIRPDRPLPAGVYYLEMSAPEGEVGWWSHTKDVYPRGQAFADGVPVPGDRTLRVDVAGANSKSTIIRDFFTFRKTQPSMFGGPATPKMWSWLEAYPQHPFPDQDGHPEEMAVGVAQNAITKADMEDYRREAGVDPDTPAWKYLPDSAGSPFGIHGVRLFSDPRSRGRNYHGGRNEESPDAVLYGYNFAEQWEHALREDPRFIFVTGWNEWFAGNLPAPIGKTDIPLYFCDAFNQVYSRDVEPMKGGHGDNYYYQMVSYIRRYKGARPLPPASAPKTIDVEGDFAQWADVGPEYRDTIGDTAHRDHPGYNTVTRYRNTTGRNDVVLVKVARDEHFLYFYAKTRDPMTHFTDPDWMVLFLNTDRNPDTGWEGYNIAINRRMKDGSTSVVEHTANGWNWQPKGAARFTVRGNELMLAVPRETVGLAKDNAIDIEFKWADNFQLEDRIDAFVVNGDIAPNGRFNYWYRVRLGSDLE
ncbi:MAG: hypothetical protein ACC628_06255 [Pirellulaceae bacterium]